MSKVLFIPGCSFHKEEYDTALKVMDVLKNIYDDVKYYQLCCGSISEGLSIVDNVKLVNEMLINKVRDNNIDYIIIQCASCYDYYLRNIKEDIIKDKIISIYEVLDKYYQIKVDCHHLKVNVHDPCKARYHDNLHQAIRNLLVKANCCVVDVEYSKRLTKCCGKGACLGFTNQLMKRKFVKEREAEFNHLIITYCSDCQLSFKNSMHVLKLIFARS